MFEVMIIFCYIYSAKYWQLRGKAYYELSPKELAIVDKALLQDFKRRKRFTPEEYLPKLQTSAVVLLIFGIVLTILYISLFIYIIYFF